MRRQSPRATSAPASASAQRGAGALASLDQRLQSAGHLVDVPSISTFEEFLRTVARVPVGKGEYGPYSFKGREALLEPVRTIDLVLGSTTKQPLTDATVSICGGAQFGKTVTELALGAYCTSLAWLNWGFYLPDDNLVQGIVDTKFRPDVLDQLDWFARMTQVGRAVNKSGKAVNRKGAFTVTDGKRRTNGMVIGLNKIPTTFTFDVATLDEVDDIKADREKFVRGRMTSSPLRMLIKLGTQRVAGRGQHAAWKAGSQGVMIHKCPSCGHEQNLEEEWPKCCRIAMDGTPATTDPALTATGDFRRGTEVLAEHDPTHSYYFACVQCGAALDRGPAGFRWSHRRPEMVRQRHWSFRISQFGIPAIDLSQIVADWTRAVVDPDAMLFFLCDRKAMPESASQKIAPATLDRARTIDVFDMRPRVRDGCSAYAGLDTGNRCWFLAREVERPDLKRILHAEQIALGNVVDRVTTLCAMLGIGCLCIDQAPATDEARTLALRLNGLEFLSAWPRVPEKEGWISFPGGLTWDGGRRRWLNLRCAVVSFRKHNLGAGVTQGFDVFDKGGHRMFVPLIECNRFESIDRVVREFLTPLENVAEVVNLPGRAAFIRTDPAMLLPRRGPGAPLILDTLDTHLLTGSERLTERDGTQGDYVDGCENHFLLADAYSGLAELEGGTANRPAPPAYRSVNPSATRSVDARPGRFWRTGT